MWTLHCSQLIVGRCGESKEKMQEIKERCDQPSLCESSAVALRVYGTTRTARQVSLVCTGYLKTLIVSFLDGINSFC